MGECSESRICRNAHTHIRINRFKCLNVWQRLNTTHTYTYKYACYVHMYIHVCVCMWRAHHCQLFLSLVNLPFINFSYLLNNMHICLKRRCFCCCCPCYCCCYCHTATERQQLFAIVVVIVLARC